jgi:hypothetical protein
LNPITKIGCREISTGNKWVIGGFHEDPEISLMPNVIIKI